MSSLKMYYVFSTLSCDTKYTNWEKGRSDLATKKESVLIRGGANVMDKRSLVTPMGVMTSITEEQKDILDRNPVFARHVQRGFIKVEQKAYDMGDVVSDMTSRSEDAPLTPGDYISEDKDPPVINKSKSKTK